MLTLNDPVEGYYYADYKDHGKKLIRVTVDDSGFKEAVEIGGDLNPICWINPQYYYQYIHLEKVEIRDW